MRGTMRDAPSDVQLEVLQKMMASDGRIFHVEDGFWTVDGVEFRQVPGLDKKWPSWSVRTQLVKALEALGWVRRARKHKNAAHDDRVLTSEGKAFATMG